MSREEKPKVRRVAVSRELADDAEGRRFGLEEYVRDTLLANEPEPDRPLEVVVEANKD